MERSASSDLDLNCVYFPFKATLTLTPTSLSRWSTEEFSLRKSMSRNKADAFVSSKSAGVELPAKWKTWVYGVCSAASVPVRRPIIIYYLHNSHVILQELCESRGGRPGLSVLTSLLVSVDVKNYWTVLRHWSQLVPNMSTDIWGH